MPIIFLEEDSELRGNILPFSCFCPLALGFYFVLFFLFLFLASFLVVLIQLLVTLK